MIAAWMLWSAGIGVLFLVAGLAAERLLTHGGRPTRWVWIVAGAATTALSVLRIPRAPMEPAVVPPPGFAPPLLEPLTVTVARDSMLRSLDDLLVLGWVVLSSLLVVTVLFAFARLVREGRSWQPGSLGHRSVFWSRDTGPTIVGLLRPRVVLPAWVHALGRREQELILAHEEEHIRAGDARLRFLMTLPLFVFPWNPALWLQRHRLNLAVELDCDRRVMRRMPGHRHAYGNLLLRVGAGQNGLHRVALVALSEGRSQLERRISRLEEQMPRVRRLQGVLLVLGAAAVVALAVLFPRVRGEDAPASDEPVDFMAEPVFTPYTVRPDLVNEREVMRALQAEYPPILRDAGIGGTTSVHFFIDTSGVVQRVLVAETSGHEVLDSAALRVARTFRFTPALNLDEIVPVWIAIPITFSTGAAGADGVPDAVREFADSIARERAADPGDPPADSEARQEESLADLMQEPTFTPYTVRPDLSNEREVQRAMEREYPPILRDAGIGGTVNVHFFIDAEGVVQRVLVAEPSGHEALDSAALRVARVFRFNPARDEDEPIPVWIAIPLTFQTR
ncbi:MAG: M56 family metallopeptidase [Gammaproteobacteria bacterium]|nr:M56 family metallopeptidase [Gammaproteobacteria bacterium]MYF60520.1 M56 family metallopeptidase [Gammaproteobacteria bacterium]MYI21408.1 M56 family metallopeptidase [Gammaproteobacteria bacterium]